MNILIGVHHFPPDYQEGAEQRAWRTAKALMSRGHHVRAICVERINATATPGQPGLTWRDDVHDEVPVRRLSFNLAAAPDRARFEYDNPWIGEHLRHYLQEINATDPHGPIDLFHLVSGYLMTGSTLRVAQEMGIPTVVSLTDFWFLCPRIQMLRSDGVRSQLPIDPVRCARCLAEEQRRYALPAKILPEAWVQAYWKGQTHRVGHIERRAAFLRDTLNQVNAIISPSKFLRQMFIDGGVDPKRIIYSRQGRDFAQLSAAELQKTPSTELRLGVVGKVTRQKGTHIAVEAMKFLKGLPVSLHIFGNISHDLDYVAEIRDAIKHDERIHLEGPYLPKDLTQVMRALDATVVPSVWYENSPNVILEAQAHKTPVLASNLGGMAELVQHNQNGLCFEVENAADLARQIRRLLDEPKLLAQLRAGIGPVKSVRQEMDELEQIYATATKPVAKPANAADLPLVLPQPYQKVEQSFAV